MAELISIIITIGLGVLVGNFIWATICIKWSTTEHCERWLKRYFRTCMKMGEKLTKELIKEETEEDD